MTSDGILVLRMLFQLIWKLFTSWYIPGTHTTPAAFAMFMLTAGLILRSIKSIFGSAGSGVTGRFEGKEG